MLLVLSGTSLAHAAGQARGGAGEVVAFPRGERGAHQMIHRGDEPARFLMLSEMQRPEIAVYPDSDKVGGVSGPRAPAGHDLNFRDGDAVDYWDGEEPPR